MRSLLIAAAAIACLVLVGCATQTRAGGEAGQRPLTADALRTLFSDIYVTAVQDPNVIVGDGPGEIFRSNGVYERIAGRTGVEGTFRIKGEFVCVQGPDFHSQCRQVIPRGNYTYSFIDRPGGSTKSVTITHL